MRKFRAIVQTRKEPQDHEVLWYWKGKVLFWNNNGWEPFYLTDASEVLYKFNDILTVKEALDKLLQYPVDPNIIALREVINYDNILNNSLFTEGMKYWSAANVPPYFRSKNKFVLTKGTLLSRKKGGVLVVKEDGQPVLKLSNSTISQKNEDLIKTADVNFYNIPSVVTLYVYCKPMTSGTMRVSMKNETNEGYAPIQHSKKVEKHLTQDTQYHVIKSRFLWNGTGDFVLDYDGELNIKSMLMKVDEVATMDDKYIMLFKYSDTLVQMAEEHLSNN